MNNGEWVITKMKKLGLIYFKEGDGNMYIVFPDGGSRSYNPSKLVVLDEPMQKLLNATYEEFVRENSD